MKGSIDPEKKSFVVIGAGFSGLLITYRLLKLGHTVRLFEKASRVGGLIDTVPLSKGMAETAAHSLLASPPVERLFQDLGVPLVPVNPGSRSRFIYRSGRLKRWPLTIAETLILVLKFLFSRKKSETEESLETWAKRRLGQAALDYLVNPFVRGVYGTHPGLLSFNAAFPKKNAAQKGEKRPQMKAPQGYQNGGQNFGMKALIQALEDKVRPVLSLKTEIQDLRPLLKDSNVIVTLPTAQASVLFRPISKTAAEALSRVSYSPLATLTVLCPKDAFSRAPKGVGFLVPEKERSRRVLGILFNSASFKGRVIDESKTVSLTVMIKPGPEQTLDALSEIALREISETLGANHAELIKAAEVSGRIWNEAIPVYGPQLEKAWESLNELPRGLLYFGNASGQVSLRGMIESTEGMS